MGPLVWAIRNLSRDLLSVSLHIDAKTTIGLADQNSKASEHGILIELLRFLDRVLRFSVLVSYNHVPAHEGHPWNEFADSLAKAVSKGFLPPSRLPSVLNELASEYPEDIPWLHLVCMPSDRLAQYPPMEGDSFVVTPPVALQ